MKIDQQTLHKIAHLSRLDIAPEEESELIDGLESVLTWMNQLDDVDTTNVEPLTHISETFNVFREDKVGVHLAREAAFINAPSHSETHFQVVKVIE